VSRRISHSISKTSLQAKAALAHEVR